jgi:large subunit ribosomal protein L25
MEAQVLRAETRKSTGKGAARQLRSNNMLPGILYGQAGAPVSLSVSPKELTAILSTKLARNAVIKLQLPEGEQLTMIKELQVDPLSRRLLHVDLYRVDLKTPVNVQVPFVVKGVPKGLLTGGELHVVLHELPIRATPDKIPTQVEADISHLDMYQMLQVKELQLPEGASVMLPPDRTLVVVAAEKKKAPEGAEAVEAAAEGAEAAAAGAAAGATGEKKPAEGEAGKADADKKPEKKADKKADKKPEKK